MQREGHLRNQRHVERCYAKCENLLQLQAQGKHKQALETVEGKLGDVMSMAADRRSLRASLHVRLTLLALCFSCVLPPLGSCYHVGYDQNSVCDGICWC